MKKEGLIVYSSISGNTRLLAENVYNKFEKSADLYSIENAPDPQKYSWIFLGFWVNRGTADEKTKAYIESIKGKDIGYFGTLGAYPDSEHAEKVINSVSSLISKENRLLGSFLCQGRIKSKLTEKFKKMEGNHSHKMTPERIQRHKDAESHPDDRDIKNCINQCSLMFKRYQQQSE
jgi:flavodoxin